MPEPAPFHDFAATADAIAGLAGRNDKADRLGAYLDALDDADVQRAARWIAARPFSLRDQRTVNVGNAVLLRAVAAVTGVTRDDLQPRLVALGDPGDVAEEALAEHVPSEPRLTLADVDVFLHDLARTRGTSAKTEMIEAVLRRADAVEAKYLVKLLAGELRIGLKEGGVESALARRYGHTVGAVQRANMLTGDLGEAALLARTDRLDDAEMRLFHPLKFMLATAADTNEDIARQMPNRFAVEDKFDGIRAQAHVAADPGEEGLHGVAHDGARIALFSRTLDAITPSFPDLVAPLAALADAIPAGVILDGEIVPVASEDGAAIRPFQALQRRLGRKTVPDALRAEVPVAYVVYDALFFDGDVLLEVPYEARQRRLDALGIGETGVVRRSHVEMFDGIDQLDAAFEAARDRGNEGLMVKDPGSPYKPGRRGRDWLKVKRALATLDCVVTSVEVGSGKRSHLLSDFTFAVRGDDVESLLNVGKAYSGLTDAELATLTDWFKEHTTQTFAHGRVRLRLATDDHEAVFFHGPTVELLTQEERAAHDRLNSLGPDVLAGGPDHSTFDRDEAAHRVHAEGEKPIGPTVMDQRVMAGVGNIYKSEGLFLAGIDPRRPAASVSRAELDRFWDAVIPMMWKGTESWGRTKTTPSELREQGIDRWVYQRKGKPCAVCGTPIELVRLPPYDRATYLCPRCQS